MQAQGAGIEGEAGVGFILRPGFMLPPLMFSEGEIEALVLGARWVAERTDPQLAGAAQSLLAKVSAVLPPDLRPAMEATALIVPPGGPGNGGLDLAVVRKTIRMERRAAIIYADSSGRPSNRTIWPFTIGFFDAVRMVAAWCEMRGDFRHFRCDRISAWEMLPQRMPRRREALAKAWREREGRGDLPTRVPKR